MLLVFEGNLNGNLVFPPEGKNGFGYDPIFIAEGYDKTLALLTADEKNKISHRAKSFSKLIEACFSDRVIA